MEGETSEPRNGLESKLIGLSPAGVKGSPCLVGDRVNRLALGTTVLVIDPVALIMPAHETGADELGDGATNICAAGLADTLSDLRIDDPVSSFRIDRESALGLKVLTNLVGDREPAGIALRYRHQRVAKPVPNGDTTIPVADVRTCRTRLRTRLGDQI